MGARDIAGYALRAALPFVATLVIATSAGAAPEPNEPASCRVLDPELQARYAGSCNSGLAEGRGEASGTARYVGDFRAGRKHGQGTKTWANGDRYEGGFVDDRKEGVGTYTWGAATPWADERYVGHYVADQRDGYGTYEWPDGDRYAGPWKNDAPAGPLTPRMRFRAQQASQRLAAVSGAGAVVCRQMRVGSVVADWIRGTVSTVEGQELTVRIEDAGQFAHRIGGTDVAKGAVVRDARLSWIPCTINGSTP